jgi:hypothetical protein
MLRTTLARWRRDGTFDRLMETGAKVIERMHGQFQHHLWELTVDRQYVTGEATETMPRWTHIRRPKATGTPWTRRSA